MPIDVSWTLGRGTPQPIRGRLVIPAASSAAQEFRDTLGFFGEASAERLAEVAHTAYPRLQGVRPYKTWRERALFVGVRVRDAGFFYREWDTRPHWPPFGKHSELRAWVEARGLDPRLAFFIARKMAPVEASNRVFEYTLVSKRGKEYQHSHKATVMGEGGYESKTRPGHLVATSGKYALTDALEVEARWLAARADDLVKQGVADAMREF